MPERSLKVPKVVVVVVVVGLAAPAGRVGGPGPGPPGRVRVPDSPGGEGPSGPMRLRRTVLRTCAGAPRAARAIYVGWARLRRLSPG